MCVKMCSRNSAHTTDNMQNVQSRNLIVVTHDPATALFDDRHVMAAGSFESNMHNGCR